MVSSLFSNLNVLHRSRRRARATDHELRLAAPPDESHRVSSCPHWARGRSRGAGAGDLYEEGDREGRAARGSPAGVAAAVRPGTFFLRGISGPKVPYNLHRLMYSCSTEYYHGRRSRWPNMPKGVIRQPMHAVWSCASATCIMHQLYAESPVFYFWKKLCMDLRVPISRIGY